MKNLITSLLTIFILTSAISFAVAQQTIDGDFAFQSDTAKKYSLYIPSSYNPANPNPLMIGLHPFNTNRWWAESWRDTLIVFAETNGLIMVCPDGGVDGKVDDAIDTAFTSALMDSMELWYNIDTLRVYAMGFSWGGRTTYTYGLSHHWRFGGFLPIGAAINGTSEVNETLQQNAVDKPFYIVHGDQDIPATRFYPIRDSLISKGAIVNSILLPTVGHTIDFTNRNQILTDAFLWIDSVNVSKIDTSSPPDTTTYSNYNAKGNDQIRVITTSINKGGFIKVLIDANKADEATLSLYSLDGKLVSTKKQKIKPGRNNVEMETSGNGIGIYILNVSLSETKYTQKVFIK